MELLKRGLFVFCYFGLFSLMYMIGEWMDTHFWVMFSNIGMISVACLPIVFLLFYFLKKK